MHIVFDKDTDPYQILRAADISRIVRTEWGLESLRGETVRFKGRATLLVDAVLTANGRVAGSLLMIGVHFSGQAAALHLPKMLEQFGEAFNEKLVRSIVAILSALIGRKNGELPDRFNVDADAESISQSGPSERLWPGRSAYGTFLAHSRRYQFAAGLTRPEHRVLDLGCGVGYGLGMLPCAEGVGVDISDYAVATAQKIYDAPDRTFVKSPIEELAESDAGLGQFDVITCFEVIEHLEDHIPLLQLAAGSLKKEGGKLIISVPCPALHGMELNPYHIRDITAEHFRVLMEDTFHEVAFYQQSRDVSGDLADRYIVSEGMDEDAEFWIAVCRFPKKQRKRPLASIVMPLYNNCRYTQQSLESIARHTTDKTPYEVILVDNASTDGTSKLLDKLQGDVVIVRNRQNLGFARASNQGAMLARGEYVVFLNNDTEVHEGWLDALTDELENNPQTGIVGGRLLYPDGTIQHAGVAIGRDMVPFHMHRRLPKDHPLVLERRAYPVVTAACAAVRRTQFYTLGMFDEQFVNGHEDIDVCFRYRKKGQSVIYRPDCLVTHFESISDGRMNHRLENLARTELKWRHALIQDDFCYWCTEASRQTPDTPLRFAIKIGPPDRKTLNWGDTYFAESLARELVRLGHDVRIDYLCEWGRRDLDIDVVVHIKGLSEYHPKPYNVNILWMLNHPSLHTKEELSRYDAVLVASRPHAEALKGVLDTPVFEFLQATDARHFQPTGAGKKYDIVFVGNNKGAGRLDMRKSVADLLPTDHSLAVWGSGWEGLLPDNVWKGTFVPWEKLPNVYSQGRIVLNDHQPEMAECGFINNRTYDAIASGARVVSDHVESMGDLLDVPAYSTREELHALVDDLLSEKGSGRYDFEALRTEVLRSFTFERRAVELTEIISGISTGEVSDRIRVARENIFAYRENRPLVSVLMSTHNRRRFLQKAINSVRSQTYTNWELIVVCDGGDGVADIVAGYADPRIRLVELPEQRGKGYAVNRAYREARGEYIAFLDDDDIYYDNHLDTLLFHFSNVPGIEMAVSNTLKVNQEEDRDHPSSYVQFRDVKREVIYYRQVKLEQMIETNKITWLSVMIRRDLFERAGGMDETLSAFLDYDFFRRLVAVAHPYHVNELTAEYYVRQYASNTGDGQITAMSDMEPVRYKANKLRVMKKRLPLPSGSDLAALAERAKRSAKHEFLLERGRQFMDRGQFERGRLSFATAVKLGHDPVDALRQLGLAEMTGGHADRMLAAFLECLSLQADKLIFDYLYVALAYVQLQFPAKALPYLDLYDQHGRHNRDGADFADKLRAQALKMLQK